MSADAAFDALGNPVRREIVRILGEGPRSVQQIAEEFEISRPAVSKHLRILTEARLVTHEADGTRNIFSIDRTGFAEARTWLDTFWDEALFRFKLLAENTTPKRKKSKR
ncbi:MAG: metalloregulator ArsR/SmtB family transcription factor [Deltaproteobacteria bacterium]|jgi:DNA-binding transcriptional ArsR family regulator